MNDNPDDPFGFPDDPHTPAPLTRKVEPQRQARQEQPEPESIPFSEEAEKHVLACCFVDDKTVDRCRDSGLVNLSFHVPGNRVLWEIIVGLRAAQKPVTLEVVAEELTDRKMLHLVGGLPALLDLTRDIPTTAHLGYFIEKVRVCAEKREYIRGFERFDHEARNGTEISVLRAEIKTWLETLSTPGKKKAAGYSVWRPADFRAWEPPPNVNILGGGYIRRKQLTTLIGPPGVGKSRLSLWLACLHITGRQCFGLDMQNGPAKWLFFGNENDPMRQKSDLDWFYRNLTTEEQAKVDSHLFLHVIDKPDDGIITLADDEAFKKLCITLKEVQPEVVVFDPWGNMIEGNENDNEEVRKTLKLLLRAIQHNCPDAAIVVIHHARTGKSTAIEAGNNYSGGSLGRGSKALVSSARCELALWPGDASDSSKLVLTCEKANNVQKFEPKGLLFENGIYTTNETFDVEAWRDDIEGNRSTKTLTIKDLVEIIRSGIHKAADIHAKAEEDLGVSKRTVTTRLAEACEKGYLMRTMPAGSYTLGNKKLT